MNSVKFLRDEIVSTEQFQLVPARSSVETALFKPDGRLSANAENITHWVLDSDGLGPALKLYANGGVLWCVYRLQPDGTWLGRERRQNGTTMIRPVGAAVQRWKDNTRRAESPIEDWRDRLKAYHHQSGVRDWHQHRWALTKPVGTPENTTAIGIAAYDRPDYLTHVVQALAKNPGIHTYPVYVFLDLPKDQTLQDRQAAIARQALPQSVIIKRSVNWGCGRNIIDLRRQLFDSLGYARVFVFEDDAVPSSNYLPLMENLLDWAEDNFSNVGAVQGWCPCLHSFDSKKTRLQNVEATFVNWWAYLMSKKCWESICSTLYYFEHTFLSGQNYADRPHAIIREWLKELRQEPAAIANGHVFPVDLGWHTRRAKHLGSAPGGQDGTTAVSFDQKGWVRLCTQVNRCRYIGARGIHMSPERYKLAGFDAITLDEFAEDTSLKEFTPSTPWNAPTLMEGLVHARKF